MIDLTFVASEFMILFLQLKASKNNHPSPNFLDDG